MSRYAEAVVEDLDRQRTRLRAKGGWVEWGAGGVAVGFGPG